MENEYMKTASFHNSSQLQPQSPPRGRASLPLVTLFQYSTRHREGAQDEFKLNGDSVIEKQSHLEAEWDEERSERQ